VVDALLALGAHGPVPITAVIADVAAEVAASDEARARAEREQRERVPAWERQQAQKQEQWRRAVADARVAAREKPRKDTPRAALDAWATARPIRALCDALEAGCAPAARDGSAVDDTGLRQWISRMHAPSDAVDPVTSSLGPARVLAGGGRREGLARRAAPWRPRRGTVR
jgi:hypothetical protein